MLAEADTIQKAKELKSLALTAADWAKRKGMGEEAVRHCRSYALEAERKLGEMLLATERAKGAKGNPRGRGASIVQSPDVTAQPTLSALGISKRESSEAQALARVDKDKFERLKAGEITKADTVGEKRQVHVSFNSGENEWYTPSEYIRAAVEVMGGIDVDPASSKAANRTVGASKFYTSAQDGLLREWKGRVWLNPPYSQPLISQFSEALVSKFSVGEVTEACVLVNNATETGWFQGMLRVASAVCFVTGRIKFIDPAGKPSGAPLQGQAVLYLGSKPEAFAKAFGKFGIVLFHEL